MSSTRSQISTVIADYLASVIQSITNDLIGQLTPLVQQLAEIREAGSRVFVCGNGGSCANAAHMVLHLREIGIHALDLTADSPWVTALANDYGYEQIFSRSLQTSRAGSGDMLIVISGSGNSPNILAALKYARKQRMTRWGLLGRGGGKALALCDYTVVVDSQDYGPIEDTHGIIAHAVKQALTI